MKEKLNQKRIVVQEGQDLIIKIYGDFIIEKKFSHKEIFSLLVEKTKSACITPRESIANRIKEK